VKSRARATIVNLAVSNSLDILRRAVLSRRCQRKSCLAKFRNSRSIHPSYRAMIMLSQSAADPNNCRFTWTCIFHLTVNIIDRSSQDSAIATGIGTPREATSYADASCLLLIHPSVDASSAIAHRTMNYYFLRVRRRPTPLRSPRASANEFSSIASMSMTPRFSLFYRSIDH